MRTSFSQNQKQILSGTPYALEEQSHGTLYQTSKQVPWKKTLKELKRCLVKFDTDKMNFKPILAATKNRLSNTNTFNSFNIQLYIFTTYFSNN